MYKLNNEQQDERMNEQIQLQRPSKLMINCNERRKYGNMVVFFENPFLFTLGPDYWCFLPTFIIFCTVSYLMISFVFNNSPNIYFRAATLLICGGMCLSYFLVATSNPGVATQQDVVDQQQQQNPMTQSAMGRKRLCRKCNIMVRRNTQHCVDCDVCIKQYDHHCPWTSKCIGGGNLMRFYFFLAMVPVYLIYVFVAFATLMSQLALQSATNHLQTAARAIPR